jgi:uncharacterized tellurite resistance protein B-like protein
MYLSLLNPSEKLAFYSLAHALAGAHEGISAEEDELLDAALREMNIAKPEGTADLAEACAQIQSEQSKRIALLELMLIALVDDDFADSEESVISTIVGHLGLSDGSVNVAASLAESMHAQNRRGLRFIQA